MKLNNQVAMITGASSGIGESISKLFAAEGASVALVARRADALQKVSDEIQQAGGSANAYSLDVTDAAAVTNTVAQIENELGGIDILVNCAGVFTPSPTGDSSYADWVPMININLVGTINLCSAVGAKMKTRERGQIINTASVAAVMGISGYSVYCASKAGVAMYTRAIGRELAPFNIHVNAIAPGNTATPINEDIRTQPEQRAFLAAMDALTPSNRTYSDPQDMARIALFLVTEGTPFYGSLLLADEGLSLGM